MKELTEQEIDAWLKDQTEFDLWMEAERYTGVFLDQTLPTHPDYVYLKIERPITKEEYYPTMNRFFDRVEKELKMNIIVAKHPYGHYNEYKYTYEDRISNESTIKLVKESDIVFLHGSRAVNFALLYYKPIVFIIPERLRKEERLGTCQKAMANWLGKKVYSLEEPINWKHELQVDREIYDKYKRAWICYANDDKVGGKVVGERLKKGFQ